MKTIRFYVWHFLRCSKNMEAMKVSLICIMMAMSNLYCFGQNVIIKQKNGSESIISLSSKPVITFDNNKMIVESSSSTIILNLDDVLEYVFDEESGIKDLTTKSEISGGKIKLAGYPINTSVIVATLDGKILIEDKTDSNGDATIELNNLPKGLMIIKVAKLAMKVLNK